MAALLVDELPEGADWSYELKLDGYRAVLIKHARQVQILSRKRKDLTRDYPSITSAAKRLTVGQITLDGEIVALDGTGRPSFQTLQNRSQRPRIVFYAFDVLHLEGHDLTRQPLERRQAILSQVVSESGLLISKELPGSTADRTAATIRHWGL